ncbi:hypothetical protein C463_14720 [Halorubrum californiense DSM 19288]|uniref:Uncharacterized protein n=1 Tax=Halorubrum californiense DSM 19288 TaxID=1227465 RepID=M0E0W3_9EURY|nr:MULTISPECIES: hypothetical protein [Halorubrum]ELZ40572.1 hypothetical protein C463_14720 [Halorubrum californiense DSM 19288]TKX72856.1 hypothetical protein EXE40_02525 [Halorubrum sp. GN11GM_10-3_MGM]
MGDETEASESVTPPIQRAARESSLGRLWRRAGTAIRHSFLYRWLTAEPDPEVIVIDLRETWTVGPFIRLLDAVLDRVFPALDNSRVASTARTGVQHTLAAPMVIAGVTLLVGGLLVALTSVATQSVGTGRLGLAAALIVAGGVATRERRSWAKLRETRPVELLIAALEPPEPPEETSTSDSATDTESPTDTADPATNDKSS